MDTVRADTFGGLGAAQQDSLNAWEDRALVFSNTVSSSSWTAPAVASVFSGLWQAGHGAGQAPGNRADDGDFATLTKTVVPSALYEDVGLLAEAAKAHGFQTASISASPWTNTFGDTVGLTKGFTEQLDIGMDDSRLAFSKMKDALSRKPEGAPYFHYLHIMEAHEWHMLPEAGLNERIAKFTPEERALWLEVAPDRTCEDKESLICRRYLVYASAVREVRQSIAALLADMEGEGLLSDTVVVLFSDHGEEFGDHAGEEKIIDKVEGFPDRFIGHGHSMYREVLRVPLLVWHPDYEAAEINGLASLVDVGPTVARWLNIDFSPAGWPGIYLDEFVEPTQKALDRVAFAHGIVVGEPQTSAQQGARKSIWYMDSDQFSYFDLASDPNEMHSLPSDQLVMYFDGLFMDDAQNRRQRKVQAAPLSEEHIKRLQAIGYLQGVESEPESKQK